MADLAQDFGVVLPRLIQTSPVLHFAVLALASRSLVALKLPTAAENEKEARQLFLLSQAHEKREENAINVKTAALLRKLWHLLDNAPNEWQNAHVPDTPGDALTMVITKDFDSSCLFLLLRIGE